MMHKQKMKTAIKCTIYYLAKALGLLRLASTFTKNQYRILCYHGGSLFDEHVYMPTMFISNERLKRHLQLIEKYHFKVITLDELVKNVEENQIIPNSLVLTFDDGFYNTKAVEPLLKAANYPATLYVTTYYVTHQRPNFNMSLAYLFYKSKIQSITLSLINDEEQLYDIKGKGWRDSIVKIIEYAKKFPENEQNEILRKVADKLEMDFDTLCEQRLFYNFSPEELKTLFENGVFDLQLHTHRHNLPNDDKECMYEIEKNRQLISEYTGKKPETLRHFCYPSGLWNENNWPYLRKFGIVSATTLEDGLNRKDTELLALKRILCADDKPLILFEAELSGLDAFIKSFFKRISFR